jgi:hypothetical protein
VYDVEAAQRHEAVAILHHSGPQAKCLGRLHAQGQAGGQVEKVENRLWLIEAVRDL